MLSKKKIYFLRHKNCLDKNNNHQFTSENVAFTLTICKNDYIEHRNKNSRQSRTQLVQTFEYYSTLT